VRADHLHAAKVLRQPILHCRGRAGRAQTNDGEGPPCLLGARALVLEARLEVTVRPEVTLARLGRPWLHDHDRPAARDDVADSERSRAPWREAPIADTRAVRALAVDQLHRGAHAKDA